MRRHNRSAFRGYRETPSAYSEVTCPHDLARWRTRADYVDRLPDGDLAQVQREWAARNHPPPNPPASQRRSDPA